MFAFRMHMDGIPFTLAGKALTARPSGALWCPAERWLCVSDLHLGRSERIARSGGVLLPPYDDLETLSRLEAEIDALSPTEIICLGDSFDDGPASAALPGDRRARLIVMMAGRRWNWVAGNHDPGPPDLPGDVHAELRRDALTFRHEPGRGARDEIAGHFHPRIGVRLGGRMLHRRAFLVDGRRAILPAFGAYTGGLDAAHPELLGLMEPGAWAILTGRVMLKIPLGTARRTGASATDTP